MHDDDGSENVPISEPAGRWTPDDGDPIHPEPRRSPAITHGRVLMMSGILLAGGAGAAISGLVRGASLSTLTAKVAASSDTRAARGASSPGSPSASAPAGLVDITTNLSYEGAAAAGTGMLLTSNGEVLTNNHVIVGATSISVTDVDNGKTYRARVVGYDRTADVAVLQLVGATGLQVINAGDSSTVRVGDAVTGVGNAGGAGGTPSSANGVVTALNQSITASDESSGFSEQLSGLIETNADIQPGDSGGSLVNAAGQVIGMDTAASTSNGFGFYGSTTTTSFAIPISRALRIAGLIESGAASATVHIGATPFLGVDVTSTTAAQSGNEGSSAFGALGGFDGLGYPGTSSSPTGALVAGVVSMGPAARAGIATGDTITSVAGKTVSSPTALTNILEMKKAGSEVRVVYVDASGASHSVMLRLASGPPQ